MTPDQVEVSARVAAGRHAFWRSRPPTRLTSRGRAYVLVAGTATSYDIPAAPDGSRTGSAAPEAMPQCHPPGRPGRAGALPCLAEMDHGVVELRVRHRRLGDRVR